MTTRISRGARGATAPGDDFMWGRMVSCGGLLIRLFGSCESLFAACRFVGQVGRGTLWVRPIVNRPAASLGNFPGPLGLDSACRFSGRGSGFGCERSSRQGSSVAHANASLAVSIPMDPSSIFARPHLKCATIITAAGSTKISCSRERKTIAAGSFSWPGTRLLSPGWRQANRQPPVPGDCLPRAAGRLTIGRTQRVPLTTCPTTRVSGKCERGTQGPGGCPVRHGWLSQSTGLP